MKCMKLVLWLSSIGVAAAQTQPQCIPSTDSTRFNGTAGSELQLNGTTIRAIGAADADQGVAVDADYSTPSTTSKSPLQQAVAEHPLMPDTAPLRSTTKQQAKLSSNGTAAKTALLSI